MSRKEFMERLEELLRDIPDNEREEALQYYNDYFDDAGMENEAEVIRDLGSPELVAQKLKAGLGELASAGTPEPGQGERKEAEKEKTEKEKTKKEAGFWKILSIVLLCILAAPVVLPLAGGLLLAAVTVVLALFGAIAGIVLAGFAILLAGIAVLGVGIVQTFATPAIGIAAAGVGCIVAAVGVLLSFATVWCCIRVIPWLIRGIAAVISYPFRKRKAGA